MRKVGFLKILKNKVASQLDFKNECQTAVSEFFKSELPKNDSISNSKITENLDDKILLTIIKSLVEVHDTPVDHDSSVFGENHDKCDDVDISDALISTIKRSLDAKEKTQNVTSTRPQKTTETFIKSKGDVIIDELDRQTQCDDTTAQKKDNQAATTEYLDLNTSNEELKTMTNTLFPDDIINKDTKDNKTKTLNYDNDINKDTKENKTKTPNNENDINDDGKSLLLPNASKSVPTSKIKKTNKNIYI